MQVHIISVLGSFRSGFTRKHFNLNCPCARTPMSVKIKNILAKSSTSMNIWGIVMVFPTILGRCLFRFRSRSFCKLKPCVLCRGFGTTPRHCEPSEEYKAIWQHRFPRYLWLLLMLNTCCEQVFDHHKQLTVIQVAGRCFFYQVLLHIRTFVHLSVIVW